MRRVLLLSVTAALAACAPASAATLNVPGQYPTLAAAYNAAKDGDTIQVADGVYPRQDIPAGSKAVTFKGGPGVIVRRLFTDAANATFDGINVDAGGANLFNQGAAFEPGGSGMTFKNAYVGNLKDDKAALIGSDCIGCVFDNVHFRDVLVTDSAVHNECVYSQAPNVTIRNSRFTNCATMDVFFTRGDYWGQPLYGGFTLTGNAFGIPRMLNGVGEHFCAVSWHTNMSGIRNATLRGNTFEKQTMCTNGQAFSGSVESCNTPTLNYPGLMHEACGAPIPIPTPTPAPTATPTPEPAYDPACAPTCDQVIADLRTENARVAGELEQALARIGALEAQVKALQDRIAAARAALD